MVDVHTSVTTLLGHIIAPVGMVMSRPVTITPVLVRYKEQVHTVICSYVLSSQKSLNEKIS